MNIKELFEDQTIPQLRQSIERGFPTTTKRQHSTNEVTVANLQYLSLPGNGIFRAVSNTTSTNGNPHRQFIDLRNVELGEKPDGVSFTDKGGKEHTINPIPLNTTNVGVYCDCEDYTMRFANYNIRNNCHIGPVPPRYVRKTTDRPEANPQHVPGMCKHLLKVIDQIRGEGLIIQ